MSRLRVLIDLHRQPLLLANAVESFERVRLDAVEREVLCTVSSATLSSVQ